MLLRKVLLVVLETLEHYLELLLIQGPKLLLQSISVFEGFKDCLHIPGRHHAAWKRAREVDVKNFWVCYPPIATPFGRPIVSVMHALGEMSLHGRKDTTNEVLHGIAMFASRIEDGVDLFLVMCALSRRTD